MLGLFLFFFFPQVVSGFWCDTNFGWRMDGEKAIDDCNLLQDRLTLHLDRLVTVTDCVKS